MLSSLDIKNFKGIREGTISDLAQVNILVGRNNSGKSTILDALLLMRCAFAATDYLQNFGPYQIIDRRVQRRDSDSHPKPDLRELCYMMNTELPVRLNGRFGASAAISQEWKPLSFGGVFRVTSAGDEWHTRFGIADHQSVEDFRRRDEWVKASQMIGEESATRVALSHLIDASTLRRPFLEQIWGRLFSDRRDRILRDMVNDIYGLEIETFNQSDFGAYNRVTAGLPDKGVAVDWLGDGLRYALNILALGMLLEGTILMVEEPESHQHPESLRKLTQTLFELAKKQNLQLFLTTHSWELMTYALEAAEEKELELAFHHLDLLQDGILEARAIASPDARLLMDIGHDPRRIYKYTGTA